MSANDKQVGGDHYKRDGGPEHWDWAADMPYLEARCTAYIERHSRKNGLADIEKALHFLQKIAERRYGALVNYSITVDTVHCPDEAQVDCTLQNPYANIDPESKANAERRRSW